MTPVVEVRGLRKVYAIEGGEDVVALRGVDLTIDPGEFVAVMGPSGSGKSTFMHIVGLLDRPTAGTYRFAGHEVSSLDADALADLRSRALGFVFQAYNLLPRTTAMENVELPMIYAGVPADKRRRAALEALDAVGLGRYAHHQPNQLSGGQQQRVALARAFVFQPQVLLFDEPLSNLDAKLRGDMRIELRELQHRLGVTSVYVTHDLEEALAMSDRIVVMRDGLIAQVGSPGDIYNTPRNAFVADFVGSANLISGKHRTDLDADGLIALETPSGAILYGMAHGRPAGATLTMSVRTVHLHLSLQKPNASRNVWPVRIERTVFQGDFTQTHVAWGDQRLVVRAAGIEPLAEGQQAFMTVDPGRVVLLEE